MVRGMELFRERFSAFSDSFIVIGGTACDMNLSGYGGFRRTKDIDMIVITENLTDGFVSALHGFLDDGGYECYVSKDRRPHYYRFLAPKGSAYPAQIEMLSQSVMPERPGARFTPLALSDDVKSLSAIVLDPEYYEFAKRHVTQEYGVPCLTMDALVVFKSAAYLNLREERENGARQVRSEDMNKHRNDVFRLLGTMVDDVVVEVPDPIRIRMGEFLSMFPPESGDWDAIRAAIGPTAVSPQAYVEKYRSLFGLP